MKAISIKQPYASLIADGVKTIELRTWQTTYRGPLLIVSSASPAGLVMPLPDDRYMALPAGRMLAVVDLVGIEPATAAHAAAACADPAEWAPAGYAWRLANPRHVRPVPVRGRLNLYPVDDALIDVLDADDHHANHL